MFRVTTRDGWQFTKHRFYGNVLTVLTLAILLPPDVNLWMWAVAVLLISWAWITPALQRAPTDDPLADIPYLNDD